MTPKLKESIESGILSEMDLVEFLSILKIMSKNEILDPRNYKMVLDHFGIKKKKGWLKLAPGSKVKI